MASPGASIGRDQLRVQLEYSLLSFIVEKYLHHFAVHPTGLAGLGKNKSN